MKELSKEGKQELALALLLWKDFKCDGKWNLEVTRQCYEFVLALGVKDEYDALMPKLPPMRITPR